MTLFSFEVPIAHLWEFDGLQDFTFGLSYLLGDPRYEEYFIYKCRTPKHLVYLDNSWNETLETVSPQQMASLYLRYHPDAVVAPDSDRWDSVDIYRAYIALGKILPQKNIMFIFRNNQEREFINTFGPESVPAASYWWADKIAPKHLSGAHSLGLMNLDLVRLWQPPTLDTSQMVKMALRGERFEDWDGLRRGHPTRKVEPTTETRRERADRYFNLKLTQEQLELAKRNMEALKVAVNRPLQSYNGQVADHSRTMEVATSAVH